MTGNEVVHQIRETRLDAKVICMTGTSEDVRLKGVPVLAKPFSLKTLHRSMTTSLQHNYGKSLKSEA
jgi:DNA-binding response OmpR family regulator